MMKWHQLTESVDENNLEEFILKNCQPYIKENPDWKIDPLFRGINDHKLVSIHQIRTDRNPKDSRKFYHDLYNAAFAANNISSNRSNSIFCTGDSQKANQYGRVYVIFPIGNFKYTWSPTIEDLYNEAYSLLYNDVIHFKNADADVLTADDFPETLRWNVDDGTVPEKFSYNFIADYLDRHAFDVWEIIDEHDNQKELFNRLKFDVSNFNKKFGELYETTNLQEAILSDNEIMISGGEYLAVKKEVFFTAIKGL